MTQEKNSRGVRIHKDLIEIFDDFIGKFNKIHGIDLSYNQTSKKIASIINKSKFLEETDNKDEKIDYEENTDINTKLIRKEVELENKMNAEFYAKEFYEKKGYEVHFTKHIYSDEKKIKRNNVSKSPNGRMFDILCLYDNYPGLRKCIEDRLGRPDLLICKGNKIFFVEVKTGEDGLRVDQLEWMQKHQYIKTIIFYLKQIIKEDEERNNCN